MDQDALALVHRQRLFGPKGLLLPASGVAVNLVISSQIQECSFFRGEGW
jgi:hypothetical protein